MRTANRRAAAIRNASILESLETRRLMTATLGAPYGPGGAWWVHVTGTDYSDIITVQVTPTFGGNVIKVQENLTTTGNWYVPAHVGIVLYGKGGDDTMTVNGPAAATVWAQGDDGNDTITVTGAATAYLHGNNGNDNLTGGSANDILYGEAGTDLLKSNAGNDTLYGGSQPWLDATTDRDVLEGGDGRDILHASLLGNNVLRGGRGNDDLFGAFGNDLLDGGPGPTVFWGITTDPDSDLLDGGAGTDTADYSARTDNLNISLDDVRNDGSTAGNEKDNVVNCETVRSGRGNDTFSGRYAATYFGGAGRDTFNLRNGLADTLYDDPADSTFNTDPTLDLINPPPRKVINTIA